MHVFYSSSIVLSFFSKYLVPKSEFLGTDAGPSDIRRIFFETVLVQLYGLSIIRDLPSL